MTSFVAVVNLLKVWLRLVTGLTTSLLLCHCSAPAISQGWRNYDPLHQPPPQTIESLEKEAGRLEDRLRNRPDDRRSLARLADVRFLQNRESEAVELYRKSLSGSRKSANLEHWARFGTALLHVEENGEARAVLEAVLEEDPENARALLSYAEYQANIVGDSAYAMSLLRRAKQTGGIFIPPDFEQALEQNLN